MLHILQGVTRTASRSAKTPPRTDLNSESYGQVEFSGKPYRYRVTLFVESHGTPDHERDSDGIQERDYGKELKELEEMFRYVLLTLPGSGSNRVERTIEQMDRPSANRGDPTRTH